NPRWALSGDGPGVNEEGASSHANAGARALGIAIGMSAHEAAQRLTRAGEPRAVTANLVDERPCVVDEVATGRVVCLDTLSFATADNAGDVLCGGSHSGRVNIEVLLRIVHPRGLIASDGGMARARSGISGLARLDDAGVAGAAVGVMSARIGDGRSTWQHGVIRAAERRRGQA